MRNGGKFGSYTGIRDNRIQGPELKSDEAKRQELADFLKKRRAALKPEQYGLPGGGRRRASGLRREEVAVLAGVSTVWYTWLEQARDVSASQDALFRISTALRLRTDELDYLIGLAEKRPDRSSRAVSNIASVQQLLDGMSFSAYARTPLWNLIAWNGVFEKHFGSWPRSERTPNILRALFLNREFRSRLNNSDDAARNALSRFRLDYGRNANNPGYQEFVRSLQKASSDFRSAWDLHRIKGVSDHPIEVRRPNGRTLKLDRLTLHPEGLDNITVVVHMPWRQSPRPGDPKAHAQQ